MSEILDRDLREKQEVAIEQEDGVLTIWLNRPSKLNALTYPMYVEIGAAIDYANADSDIGVIVIRGAGRAFSAGFDLSLEVSHTSPEEKIESLRNGSNQVRWKIWNSNKPVVAAVHGYCLAGAFELILPTDLTIATADTAFGEPEILFGVGPAFMMVPWMMNHKQAKEILLLGEQFSAENAYDVGLVNRVVDPDEFDYAIHKVTDKLRKVPHEAAATAKRGINRVFETKGMVPHINSWVETVAHLATFENPVANEFKRKVETLGPKEAAKWRSKYYDPGPPRP